VDAIRVSRVSCLLIGILSHGGWNKEQSRLIGEKSTHVFALLAQLFLGGEIQVLVVHKDETGEMRVFFHVASKKAVRELP